MLNFCRADAFSGKIIFFTYKMKKIYKRRRVEHSKFPTKNQFSSPRYQAQGQGGPYKKGEKNLNFGAQYLSSRREAKSEI